MDAPTKPLSRNGVCGALKARTKSERCDECARSREKKERLTCACGCGAAVARSKGYTYASVACLKAVEYRQWVTRWLAGEEDGAVGKTTISHHIRRWLAEIRGERCKECGWKEIHPKTGKVPLAVHQGRQRFQQSPRESCDLLPQLPLAH